MIDKKHAGNEVGRMIGLDYFPTNGRAIAELVSVLRLSDTEAIATMVVNDWIEASRERPTPADLRRMVAGYNELRKQRIQQEHEAIQRPSECSLCDDSGIVGGVLDGKGRDAGPARWCSCRAAELRRDMDAKDSTGDPNFRIVDGQKVDMVTAFNWALEKLQRRVARNITRNKPESPMTPAAEVYNGDF